MKIERLGVDPQFVLGQITLADLQVGDLVRYVPGHVDGNANHPDCEDGIVRGFSDRVAFVVYSNATRGEIDTLEKASRWTAAGTMPSDLVLLCE